ncbi:MAG: dUTP diphosphatase [Clostridia bacterium]|nr:dUTP diphosphatase [Clostridia bacterium]
MQSIKVKRVRENAVLPKRATEGAAGADLYACIDKPITIESGDLVMIPTGIAIELHLPSVAGFVFARSGLGIKYGICPSNAVGVIDSDYRGEICVGLTNHGKQPFVIEPQMRIAQLVIMPVVQFDVEETQELCDTKRGNGGFGSTGVK